MTNTQMLRQIVRDSGLKYQYIAEKMGLSRFGLMKKIDGENEFKASEIENLCEILKIDSLEQRMQIFFANEVENNSTLEGVE